MTDIEVGSLWEYGENKTVVKVVAVTRSNVFFETVKFSGGWASAKESWFRDATPYIKKAILTGKDGDGL